MRDPFNPRQSVKMVIKQAFLVLSLTTALALSGCSRQQSDWEKTRAANTTEAYELFLKKYPSGEFAAQAQARVKELYEERDWQKARDTDTLDAYQAFLKQYPEGKWTEEARIRVENFTLASAPSSTAQPGTETATAEAAPPPAALKPAPSPAPSKPAAAKAQAASSAHAATKSQRATRRIQIRCRCRQQTLGETRPGIPAVAVRTVAQSLAQEGHIRHALSLTGRGIDGKARERDL
jgi:hypothetical protein